MSRLIKPLIMRRILFIFVVFILASGTALSQSSFGIAGLAGTKAGVNATSSGKLGFGIHARFVSSVSDNVGLIGGFTYYLPSTITALGVETKWNYMTANADLMFYLANEDDFKFYVLGGATYTSLMVTAGGISGNTDWLFGWEAGAGVEIGRLFIEGKYDAKLKQVVGTLGFYF